MSLTVACVWVQGHVPYGVEYVARLASMVRRALTRPYAFVCLTDQPRRVPAGVIAARGAVAAAVEGLVVEDRTLPAVALHGPRALSRFGFADRAISSIRSSTIRRRSRWCRTPGKPGGTFPQGREGLTVVKRFNSSVMVWDADGAAAISSPDWTPDGRGAAAGATRTTSANSSPDAAAMPMAWFPRISQIADGPVPADAKVVLCKKPKNVDRRPAVALGAGGLAVMGTPWSAALPIVRVATAAAPKRVTIILPFYCNRAVSRGPGGRAGSGGRRICARTSRP